MMKLISVTVYKAALIVMAIFLFSQPGSADSLKQFFGSIGCNLSKDNQLKNSAAQIDKFVEEKDYLKAWKEFNSNFWQSESNKTMSCYYNLKKDELRKLAIEDLRGLQKNLKEYEGQRDVGKYELFLDGFKEMFGQFWTYTSPGGPMKEPLTGKFYEKHLAIAKQIKANLKQEEDERLDAAEKARKEEEKQRQLAEEVKVKEQERLANEAKQREMAERKKKDTEKKIAIKKQTTVKLSTPVNSVAEQRSLNVEELRAYFTQKIGGVSVEGYCKMAALMVDIKGAAGLNQKSYFECLRTMVSLPLDTYREFITESITQHVTSWATSPDIIDRGIQGWYVDGRNPVSGNTSIINVTNDLEVTFDFSPQSFLKEIQNKISGVPNMMASANFMGTQIDDLSVGTNIIKTENNLLQGADCFVQVFSKPNMGPDDVLINLKSKEKCTRLFVAAMEVIFKKSGVNWEKEYNRIWDEDFSRASLEKTNMFKGPLAKVRYTLFFKNEESGRLSYGIFISRKKKK